MEFIQPYMRKSNENRHEIKFKKCRRNVDLELFISFICCFPRVKTRQADKPPRFKFQVQNFLKFSTCVLG